MNETAARRLREIVSSEGQEIINEPRRLQALLSDRCGEFALERNLLSAAFEAGVPDSLVRSSEGGASSTTRERLATQLESSRGMEREKARWAVEAWALALGLSVPTQDATAAAPPPAPAGPPGPMPGARDPGLTLGPEDLAGARAMGALDPLGPPPGPPAGPPSGPPPWASTPPMSPLQGPPSGARGRRRKRQLLAGFLILALGGGVGAIAAINGGSAGADVVRVGAQSPGPNSWMNTLVPPSVSIPPITPPSLPPTATTSKSTTPSPPPVMGNTPGLYGGTRQLSVCDVKQLVSFLQTHLDKAQAWALTQGITVDQIPRFVAGLTDVILRADTRVTNHGFANGAANKIQSVLQAGTAVLVDPLGMPRVKCNCGNPLLAPKIDKTLKYKGETWTGFTPKEVTIVQPGAQVLKLVLVDVLSQLPFQRQVGTYGTADTNAPPGITLYVPPGEAAPNTSNTSTTAAGTTTTTLTTPRSAPAAIGDVVGTYGRIRVLRSSGDCGLGQDQSTIDPNQTYKVTVADPARRIVTVVGTGGTTYTGTLAPDYSFNFPAQNGNSGSITGRFDQQGTAVVMTFEGSGGGCTASFAATKVG